MLSAIVANGREVQSSSVSTADMHTEEYEVRNVADTEGDVGMVRICVPSRSLMLKTVRRRIAPPVERATPSSGRTSGRLTTYRGRHPRVLGNSTSAAAFANNPRRLRMRR